MTGSQRPSSSRRPRRISPRSALALQAGRAAGYVSRRAGAGAGVTIGGRVTLALAPGILAEVAAGRRIVAVSGTNGKTTTTRLIAAALRASGEQVDSNDTGANLASGLATALGSGRRRDPGARAVLEVDEAVLPKVVGALDPELLVLTNLSRDQLDRYGEVSTVAARWRAMLAARPRQRVVANLRDPLIVWAAREADATWVDTGFSWREDATTCPACGALLAWSDDGFRCTCGFTQPSPDASLAPAGDVVVVGDRAAALTLELPGRWNLANAAMAVTAATLLGLDPAAAALAMATVREVGGRQATWRLPDGRRARLLLAKNPAGWTEILRFLAGTGSGVVIALNANIADGKDPSWLWDVPFELLSDRGSPGGRPLGGHPLGGHPMVAAAGERHLDMAVRLRYAEVPSFDEADPLAAAERVGGAEVDIVATYSAFVALVKRLPAR